MSDALDDGHLLACELVPRSFTRSIDDHGRHSASALLEVRSGHITTQGVKLLIGQQFSMVRDGVMLASGLVTDAKLDIAKRLVNLDIGLPRFQDTAVGHRNAPE